MCNGSSCSIGARINGVRLAAADASQLADMIRELTVRVNALDEQVSAMREAQSRDGDASGVSCSSAAIVRLATVLNEAPLDDERMVDRVDAERACEVLHRHLYGQSLDAGEGGDVVAAPSREAVDSALYVLCGFVFGWAVDRAELDTVAEAADEEGVSCGECE